jgi:hypothetical protein
VNSTTDTPADATAPEMKLELVPLPVSDVDRAKAFYESAGFGNVIDRQVSETMRVVQLTPPVRVVRSCSEREWEH